MRSLLPESSPLHHHITNLIATYAAVFLAGVGVLRLVNVLLLNETIEPRPLDGWVPMSLRIIAVLFVLGMLLLSKLRQRYLFILLSLLLLTSAGVWLRLASRLPADWQATAGAAQLVLSICGLVLLIAGMAQGESLAGFVEETWLASSRAMLKKWFSRHETTQHETTKNGTTDYTDKRR